MKISLVIPTLNGEKSIGTLLTSISEQTLVPSEILLVDSSSSDRTVEIAKSFSNVKTKIISKKDFGHGKTRNMAAKECKGDYLIFMTQDALPYDKYLIENLIKPMEENGSIAVTFARQIAYDKAGPAEKLVRSFNFPEHSILKNQDKIKELGIKTYFSSDVCAAYRKETFDSLGGFISDAKTNEDMFYAAKVINNGFAIYYASEARVYHSHNFTFRQQYQRNFILGYELEKNKNLIKGASDVSEGSKLFLYVVKKLLKEGRVISIAAFIIDCIARLLGNKRGRRAYRRDEKTAD